MRTTVTLDEHMVRELVKISNAKSKTAAVAMAVKEQIRLAKLKN
ncbi:MAG: type II toxin-antitoxin system VapB family antitoxin [Desulfobacterales bacterium]